MADDNEPEFTVDTGLFRQLGELLVGRDATALIELVKNAYDADATSLLLVGTELGSDNDGSIRVIDDGLGMTEAQFRRGFLRLAARGKAEGDRRSAMYNRKFTGEKGVGRLAAHKLGSLLEVESIADSPAHESDHPSSPSRRSIVSASIDWDLIEAAETISSARGAIELKVGPTSASSSGTELKISRLRHTWDSSDLRELARQIRNFEPPEALAGKLSSAVSKEGLAFVRPKIRDAGPDDPGMKIELQGDFVSSEEYWGSVEKGADWILEIRAERGREIELVVAPTRSGLESNPFAQSLRASMPHPAAESGPFFDARIFLRSGPVPTLERGWAQANSGVRVYLEGFRVLPYGEVGNDWLSLDFDYTRRSGQVDIDPRLQDSEDELNALRGLSARDVTLRLQPNRNFFGAVFLTDEGLGGLRSLVNREGFVPDAVFDRLVQMVRTGINVLHRAWALASYRQKTAPVEGAPPEVGATADDEQPDENGSPALSADEDAVDPPVAETDSRASEAENDATDGDSDQDQPIPAFTGKSLGARLIETLDRLQAVLENPASEDARDEALSELARVKLLSKLIIDDVSLLRVLASVGAQLAAFSHEIGQLVPIAVAAEDALRPRTGERWPPRVSTIRETIRELRRAIERQGSYLVDVSTTEARRRRSRQNLRERVDVAVQAFQTAAARKDIELTNLVSPEIRTPPMYRSELQAILSNLISNALKAAGDDGKVLVSAVDDGDWLRVGIENTGDPVEIASSEELFIPFVSTSIAIDPVLGQGMGLGLPITRELAAEYGGNAKFVAPKHDLSTRVEVAIPR